MKESMNHSLSFEEYLEEKRSELLPNGTVPLSPGSFDTSILLTNDIISQDLIMNHKPNGTLFGLGFGGVFGMLDFFENKKPDQILLFDITPEPIDVGRIHVQVMRENSDFRKFLNTISQDIYPSDLIEGQRIVHEVARLFRLGSTDPRVYGLDHIKRNYEALHALACEDKIHIGYADMFSPATVEAINHFKSPGKRHLYYVTNAPQFGLDDIKNIEPALKDMWFVDTMTPYNSEKGYGITMCRATYEELPVYDDEYRSLLR